MLSFPDVLFFGLIGMELLCFVVVGHEDAHLRLRSGIRRTSCARCHELDMVWQDCERGKENISKEM